MRLGNVWRPEGLGLYLRFFFFIASYFGEVDLKSSALLV